ncbi:alpha/beta hydrolase-fold protein [Lentisphaera profundi]|uniref:Alpha/beta hydrolase-fold protein n=1 Tax=Lentisphaera profundi TaxID=1658616 RepID=A0ABY7VWD7_9BACT|nr:alpha/beta hydrolase-fold protein [Lentisphaera profundi]WDE98535.1 alpha/beta hydrolase-fold protein [Lentisphaera profundi]
MSSFRTIEISSDVPDGLKFLTVKSAHLKGRGDITLFEPQGDFSEPLPLVILLHGVYGSHWAWAFSGNAHKTAANMINSGEIEPMVLVMPSDGLWGDGSSYTSHNERDFEKWIVEDVVKAACEASPLVNEQSPKFISGLSMGGYGALRLGLRHPQIFTAISAHSAITCFSEMALFIEEDLNSLHKSWDESEELDIISEFSKEGKIHPHLRFDCGLSDQLIEGNRLFHKQLNELKVAHTYEEFGGAHEWDYWQNHLPGTLKFFNQFCKIKGK